MTGRLRDVTIGAGCFSAGLLICFRSEYGVYLVLLTLVIGFWVGFGLCYLAMRWDGQR